MNKIFSRWAYWIPSIESKFEAHPKLLLFIPRVLCSQLWLVAQRSFSANLRSPIKLLFRFYFFFLNDLLQISED